MSFKARQAQVAVAAEAYDVRMYEEAAITAGALALAAAAVVMICQCKVRKRVCHEAGLMYNVRALPLQAGCSSSNARWDTSAPPLVAATAAFVGLALLPHSSQQQNLTATGSS